MKVSLSRDFITWVLGWHDGIKVIKPQSLIEAIKEKLKNTMDLYRSWLERIFFHKIPDSNIREWPNIDFNILFLKNDTCFQETKKNHIPELFLPTKNVIPVRFYRESPH